MTLNPTNFLIIFKSPLDDMTMRMRDFISMLKAYELINSKSLCTKDVIKILAFDDPNVQDAEGCFNLELEVISNLYCIFHK
jgi:hypothetical protein